MEAGKATVPDLTGMLFSEAAARLESAGFIAGGQNNTPDMDFAVLDQYPKPGMRASPESTVFLYME
jgi:beta-lactam-binding protein with PASTA domain